MTKKVSVAILGSTGFVGLELVKILSKHPNVNIVFFGTENNPKTLLKDIDPTIKVYDNSVTQLNETFDYSKADTVFMALPHGISHKYVTSFFDKIQIIDLSADFRLDDIDVYEKNYNEKHSASNLLNEFQYGLVEIYRNSLVNKKNIAILNLSKIQNFIDTSKNNIKNNMDLKILKEKKLVSKKYLKLKILGSGEIKKNIEITAHFASKQALSKIEKAGGKISIIKK